MNANFVFGYIYVYPKEQVEISVLEKFFGLGIMDRFIYADKFVEKDPNRPNYNAMLEQMNSGDTLYIDSLDHLGRNYDDIIDQWDHITKDIGADIIVLDNPLLNSMSFRHKGNAGTNIEGIFFSLLRYIGQIEDRKKQMQYSDLIAQDEEIRKTIGSADSPKRIKDLSADWVELLKRWSQGELRTKEVLAITGFSARTLYNRAKSLGLSSQNTTDDDLDIEAQEEKNTLEEIDRNAPWVKIIERWSQGELRTKDALALTGYASKTLYTRAKLLGLPIPSRVVKKAYVLKPTEEVRPPLSEAEWLDIVSRWMNGEIETDDEAATLAGLTNVDFYNRVKDMDLDQIPNYTFEPPADKKSDEDDDKKKVIWF